MATSPSSIKDNLLRIPDSSLTRVAEILPRLGVTKRKLKQLELIQVVREQREAGKQTLAFNARPFVLCGIPLRRPAEGQLTYSRHSGKFFLQIIGHPDFGLPFGQDRLIPIWVATLALQQNSRIVRFESASQMLGFFGLCPDGYHYRRIVDGFKRIFASTIFFGTEDLPDGRVLVDWARFHFFDQMKLWFSSRDQNSKHNDDRGNVITLSEAFYDEIDSTEFRSSGRLCLLWLTLLVFLIFTCGWFGRAGPINGRPARIPVFGPGGLNEQLGATLFVAFAPSVARH